MLKLTDSELNQHVERLSQQNYKLKLRWVLAQSY